jgi:hypothetical protein
VHTVPGGHPHVYSSGKGVGAVYVGLIVLEGQVTIPVRGVEVTVIESMRVTVVGCSTVVGWVMKSVIVVGWLIVVVNSLVTVMVVGWLTVVVTLTVYLKSSSEYCVVVEVTTLIEMLVTVIVVVS